MPSLARYLLRPAVLYPKVALPMEGVPGLFAPHAKQREANNGTPMADEQRDTQALADILHH